MPKTEPFARILYCETCKEYTSHTVKLIREIRPSVFTATKQCKKHKDAKEVGFVFEHDNFLP